MKKIIAISLSLLLTLPTATWAQSAVTLANANRPRSPIEKFIEKHKNNINVQLLTEDDLLKFFKSREDYKLDKEIDAYIAQLIKEQNQRKKNESTLAKQADLIESRAIEAEASQLVDNLFRQNNIEMMNLEIIKLLHTYLFDESSRGALRYIFDAIENYHFSPQQMMAMKKQATKLKQFADGQIVTFWALALGSLLLVRKWGPEALNKIGRLLKREAKVASQATQKSEALNEAAVRIDDILAEMDRLGVRSTMQVSESAINKAAQVSKLKVFSFFSRLNGSISFRNFVRITGISALGGAAGVGLYQINENPTTGWLALDEIFFPESVSAQNINPNELRSQYFDQLAALKLVCRTFDLYEKAKSIPLSIQNGPLEISREMNALYVEYGILSGINPSLLETQTLPKAIKTGEKGSVVFALTTKGQTSNESFACAKFKDAPAGQPIDLNMTEALMDITDAFLTLQQRLAEVKKAQSIN